MEGNDFAVRVHQPDLMPLCGTTHPILQGEWNRKGEQRCMMDSIGDKIFLLCLHRKIHVDIGGILYTDSGQCVDILKLWGDIPRARMKP